MKCTYIKADVNEHKTKVSPSVRVKDIEIRIHELICRTVGAIVATSGGIGVRDVPPNNIDEWLEIGRARVAFRGVELYEFDRRTVDLLLADSYPSRESLRN